MSVSGRRYSKTKPHNVQCPTCGASYYRTPSAAREGRLYCSWECRYSERSGTKEWLVSRCIPDSTTGCWNWALQCDRAGYGKTCLFKHGKPIHRRAHQVAFEIFKGLVLKGLVIDHVCNNRKCVNPEHLRAVTPRENVLRSDSARSAINARKTKCVNGHPFTASNTKLVKTKYGIGRQCRECINA